MRKYINIKVPRNIEGEQKLADNENYYVVICDAETPVKLLGGLRIRQATGIGIGADVFDSEKFIIELKSHKIEVFKIYEIIPYGKDIEAGKKFIDMFSPMEYMKARQQQTKNKE